MLQKHMMRVIHTKIEAARDAGPNHEVDCKGASEKAMNSRTLDKDSAEARVNPCGATAH